MNLKRNESVMHVVFLHSRTGLIVKVNAPVSLTDKILFTFDSIVCTSS